MADKDKDTAPENPTSGPPEAGTEEWEQNQKVLRGEVEPGTADLPSPVDRSDKGDKK